MHSYDMYVLLKWSFKQDLFLYKKIYQDQQVSKNDLIVSS